MSTVNPGRTLWKTCTQEEDRLARTHFVSDTYYNKSTSRTESWQHQLGQQKQSTRGLRLEALCGGHKASQTLGSPLVGTLGPQLFLVQRLPLSKMLTAGKLPEASKNKSKQGALCGLQNEKMHLCLCNPQESEQAQYKAEWLINNRCLLPQSQSLQVQDQELTVSCGREECPPVVEEQDSNSIVEAPFMGALAHL